MKKSKDKLRHFEIGALYQCGKNPGILANMSFQRATSNTYLDTVYVPVNSIAICTGMTLFKGELYAVLLGATPNGESVEFRTRDVLPEYGLVYKVTNQ